MFQEYLNNVYFHDYVNGLFQGGNLTMVALGTVSVFSTIAGASYAKLKHTRHQIGQALAEQAAAWKASTTGGLEAHQEQHLIEMIRKMTLVPSGSTDSLPMLRREDQSVGTGQGQ